MTAQEAISEIEKLKEVLINFQTLMGVEKVEAPSLDKAIEALQREAEVEDNVPSNDGELDFVQPHKKIPVTLDLKSGDDAISREEALLCLTGQFAPEEEVGKYVSIFSKRIKALPSVHPARKIGKWVKNDKENPNDWHCSRCGAIVEDFEQIYHNWLYCYHCGAEMTD